MEHAHLSITCTHSTPNVTHTLAQILPQCVVTSHMCGVHAPTIVNFSEGFNFFAKCVGTIADMVL